MNECVVVCGSRSTGQDAPRASQGVCICGVYMWWGGGGGNELPRMCFSYHLVATPPDGVCQDGEQRHLLP